MNQHLDWPLMLSKKNFFKIVKDVEFAGTYLGFCQIHIMEFIFLKKKIVVSNFRKKFYHLDIWQGPNTLLVYKSIHRHFCKHSSLVKRHNKPSQTTLSFKNAWKIETVPPRKKTIFKLRIFHLLYFFIVFLRALKLLKNHFLIFTLCLSFSLVGKFGNYF